MNPIPMRYVVKAGFVPGSLNRKCEFHTCKFVPFQSDFAIGGFMVPNEGISWSKDLRDFQFPVAEIERVSGLNFYPGVDKQRTVDLCQADSCKLIKVSNHQFAELLR